MGESMKLVKFSSFVVGLLVAACSASPNVGEGAVAVAEQALGAECLTVDAIKWQFLANFAVSVGRELGSYSTTEQFSMIAVDGIERVVLSPYGISLCDSRDGCPKVRSFLALQNLFQNMTMFGTSYVFDVQDYRETLVSRLTFAQTDIASEIQSGNFLRLPESHGVSYIGNFGISACEGPLSHFLVYRDFDFSYSESGEIEDQFCINLDEPEDSNSWSDNYLCTPRDIGIRWSHQGPISGMVCTKVSESSEPEQEGWDDNYICTPEDFGLEFHNHGAPTDPGTACVAITESTDPNSWNDNFLCWNRQYDVNHPNTIEREFAMFGGTNNPYLEFKLESASVFSIDPTDHTSGTGGGGSTGSCITVLPYTSSDVDVTGDCCYINESSLYGVLARYPMRADFYYCKTN
jgi:hypothetical protein